MGNGVMMSYQAFILVRQNLGLGLVYMGWYEGFASSMCRHIADVA